MNFFEGELRKLFRDGKTLSSPSFAGRACLGTLGKDLRVRAQFMTTGYADHYDALKITVMNRTEGEVDSLLVRFRDVWGKKSIPGNPYLKNGVFPHIWVNGGKAEWYAYQPTQADRNLLCQQVTDYLDPFRDRQQERTQDGPRLVYICAPLRGDAIHNIDFAIPFDLEKFQGDAYPTYAWAVNAIEVQVDTCTGLSKILGAYGSFDVGTPIDYNIVMGQMEGGFLQGIGYASIEKMDYDGKGRIRNNSFSDYLIPTAKDVPNLQCMLHVEKYPDGPYGAKGAGELPLVGALGAYVEAMEQALGNIMLSRVPFTAEDTLAVIRKEAE